MIKELWQFNKKLVKACVYVIYACAFALTVALMVSACVVFVFI